MSGQRRSKDGYKRLHTRFTTLCREKGRAGSYRVQKRAPKCNDVHAVLQLVQHPFQGCSQLFSRKLQSACPSSWMLHSPELSKQLVLEPARSSPNQTRAHPPKSQE
jgi:hypothetical protein